MSTCVGPSVATSGAVLNVDALNLKSYAGEATTNLMTDPLFASGTTGVNAGFEFTTTRETVLPEPSMYTISSTWAKCVKNNASNGRAMLPSLGTLITGGTYALSYYVYSSDSNLTTLNWGTDSVSNSTVTSSTSYSTSDIGTIKRVQTIFVSVSGGHTMVLRSGATNPIGTTFYITGIQVENKSAPTPFVSGSRTQVLNDLTGNLNNGTPANGPVFNPAGYIEFDGSNDYISIPYSASLAPTSAISFEVFVYMANWSEGFDRRPMSKTQSGGYQIGINETGFLGSGFTGALLYLGGTYRIVKVANSTISSGWHHLAFTCDGRYFKMYLDGATVNTYDHGSTTSISYSTNNHLVLGAEPGAGTAVDGSYFIGRIASARVYNRALSNTEIQNNFNSIRGRFGI